MVWGLAVAALASRVVAEAPAASGVAGSGLVCEVAEQSFGEARADASVTNTFALSNAGTNAVRILNVRPTCGCTTAALSTNVLPPGTTAQLTTVLSLAGRRGYQRKAVYVESDDPVHPHLKVEVTGTVITDIAAEPPGIHFGTVAATGRISRDVILAARSNLTFAVKSVNTGSSLFKAEAETRDAGHGAVIHITCEEPRAPGTASAIVQVTTDCPTQPELTIPVSVFVGGDLVAVPSQLVLVEAGTNEVRTANLSVYSPAGKAFAVKRVELPDSSLTSRVVSVTADRVRIEIQSRGALQAVDNQSIRVMTDMATVPEVKVPLRVMRLAPPGR